MFRMSTAQGNSERPEWFGRCCQSDDCRADRSGRYGNRGPIMEIAWYIDRIRAMAQNQEGDSTLALPWVRENLQP